MRIGKVNAIVIADVGFIGISSDIADFLCKSGFFGNVTIEVAESMNKEKKSVKVVFSRSCDKDTIEIASLIKLEQQIFK